MSYVQHVSIRGCRNVAALDVDLGADSTGDPRLDCRHLVLVGPNGSGKSGVIEAMAQVLGHMGPTNDQTLDRPRADTVRHGSAALRQVVS